MMTHKQVRRARGTTAVVDAYVGPVGEMVIDTDLLEIRLQNGVAGGLRVPRFGGAASFSTLAASGAVTLSGGTANGVAYLNGSKVLTTGGALTFDGTNLSLSTGKVTTNSVGVNAGFQWGGTTVTSRLYDDGTGTVYLDVGAGASNATVPLIIRTKGGSVTWNNGTSDTAVLTPTGNAGLGVTPSAWGSSYRALDMTNIGSFHAETTGNVGIGFNTYYSASEVPRYKSTGQLAFNFRLTGAGIQWLTAPSGTAGNPITFTQAMTLTQGGNLLVGTTNNAAGGLVAVGSDTTRYIGFSNTTGNLLKGLIGSSIGGSQLVIGDVADDFVIRGLTNILFSVGANEFARGTSARYFKASNTGTYGGVAGVGDLSSSSSHVFQSNDASTTSLHINGNTGSGVVNSASYLASGAAGLHFQGVLNAAEVYKVLANGNVQNSNNSYGAISQRSLKNLIAQKTGADYWEKFKQVKFWIYSLLSDPTNQQLLGTVAEELELIWPGLIERTKNVIKVQKQRQIEQTRQVTVTKQQDQSSTEIKLIDGKYVQVTTAKTVDVQVPQFDTFTVYDESGAVVMKLVTPEVQAVAAQNEVTDEEGNIVQPAIAAVQYQAAVYEPLTHQVPRMETITVTEDYEEYEEDGTETLAVKYSILGLIADTITQELQFRVEDLTTRLTALEAA